MSELKKKKIHEIALDNVQCDFNNIVRELYNKALKDSVNDIKNLIVHQVSSKQFGSPYGACVQGVYRLPELSSYKYYLNRIYPDKIEKYYKIKVISSDYSSSNSSIILNKLYEVSNKKHSICKNRISVVLTPIGEMFLSDLELFCKKEDIEIFNPICKLHIDIPKRKEFNLKLGETLKTDFELSFSGIVIEYRIKL